MPWSLELICVNAVHPHSLSVDIHGNDNNVSSGRPTQTPHREDPVSTDNSRTCQKSKKDHKASPRSAQWMLNSITAKTAKQSRATPTYTVDKIIRHVSTGDNHCYVVRWQRYIAISNIIESPGHICQPFIARYWSEKEARTKSLLCSTNH